MNLVEKALEVATRAHKGQKDKAGMDYITHPIAVASMVEGDEEKCAAYLHDVLEDTDVTEEELRKEFGDVITNAVVALTRKEGEAYLDFVRRAGENKIARVVKIADLTHNMDITRIPNPTDRDFRRVEKYKTAIKLLK